MKSVFVLSLGIVIFFQLTGCIILPLPPLGAQIGQEDVETIEAGVSTRDQIHAVLGKPEAMILDRYEIFDVGKERFNWLIMTYFGGHIKRVRGQSYRVLAEYGPEGVLRDLRWEDHGEESSEEPHPKASWADPLAAGYLSAIVWEVGTWRTLWRAPFTYATRLSFHRGFGFIFTPDGQHIISSCCLWEVPERSEAEHTESVLR